MWISPQFHVYTRIVYRNNLLLQIIGGEKLHVLQLASICVKIAILVLSCFCTAVLHLALLLTKGTSHKS